MQGLKKKSNPVDIKDFLRRKGRGQVSVKDIESWDEQSVRTLEATPVLSFSMIKLAKTLSGKLFSIDLGRISF